MEYITGIITLQAIFSLYWASYCHWYQGTIRDAVTENVNKILKCRTFQLGYHMFKCPNCSSVRLIPHSCKSRLCSSCGKIATDKWTEQRLSDILPVAYHHLVFTIPWQLRAICLINRGVILNILFSAAAMSLMSWTKQYGAYIPGIYIVLHTFGSALKFNPHLHILITAGGLSLDHKKWINAPDNFLMPEKGLKKRWRHNVISSIIAVNNKGLLQMPFLNKKGEYLNLRGVISVISKLTWYIYIGARLLEVGLTIKYIGRYTKKPVIAETRIIRCDNRWVVFKFKDYAKAGKTSVKKMGLFTFITYLTQHIPDKYFRVVRPYGIFSNRLKGQLLTKANILLNHSKQNKESSIQNWRQRQCEYSGKDPLVCENCDIEMELVFICYGPIEFRLHSKLGLNLYDKIPEKQFQLVPDTS